MAPTPFADAVKIEDMAVRGRRSPCAVAPACPFSAETTRAAAMRWRSVHHVRPLARVEFGQPAGHAELSIGAGLSRRDVVRDPVNPSPNRNMSSRPSAEPSMKLPNC